MSTRFVRLGPPALRRLTVHRFAGLFRPLAGDERDRLRKSMRGGYDPLHPIVVTPDGEIVDGRNRRDLAVELEIAAVVVEREFADDAEIAAYIASVNIARRHLDARERRELAGRLVAVDGVSTRQAGKLAGVSQSTAGRAASEARAQASHADSPALKTRTLGIDGKRYRATRVKPALDWRSRERSEEQERRDAALAVTLSVADAVRYLDRPLGDVPKVAEMFDPAGAGIGREDWTLDRFAHARAFLDALIVALAESRAPGCPGVDASPKVVATIAESPAA